MSVCHSNVSPPCSARQIKGRFLSTPAQDLTLGSALKLYLIVKHYRTVCRSGGDGWKGEEDGRDGPLEGRTRALTRWCFRLAFVVVSCLLPPWPRLAALHVSCWWKSCVLSVKAFFMNGLKSSFWLILWTVEIHSWIWRFLCRNISREVCCTYSSTFNCLEIGQICAFGKVFFIHYFHIQVLYQHMDLLVYE